MNRLEKLYLVILLLGMFISSSSVLYVAYKELKSSSINLK